jgi:dTDP-glucose pyrophosphorylase
MSPIIVYMVAGLSARFRGKIKQFAKIGPDDETLIEISVNQALKAGFDKIIFIVGEKTEAPFKEKFGEEYKGIPVEYALQTYDPKFRDRPWGTTDALCVAKNLIDDSFVVCNGDDLYGEETFRILLNHLKEKNANAAPGYVLGKAIPEEGTVNRGIFRMNPDNTVHSIKEVLGINKDNLSEKNLTEEDLCSMNIFALQPRILEELGNVLHRFKEKNSNDRRVECFLPEGLTEIIGNGHEKMYIYKTNEKWLGVTNPGDEEKIREEFKK